MVLLCIHLHLAKADICQDKSRPLNYTEQQSTARYPSECTSAVTQFALIYKLYKDCHAVLDSKYFNHYQTHHSQFSKTT